MDKTKPAPALVFLHGSGGNFKAYTWLLSRVADELGMVFIAPSYGMGGWDAKHGPRAVVAALNDAARLVSLDMNEIHLSGLSNGGLGLTRTIASTDGKRFQSLIMLSPVCDRAALGLSAFADQWNGRPVLFLTGREDDRVPWSYVVSCADQMKTVGADVELKIFDQADHFLVFSHSEEVIKNISAWLFARIVGAGQTPR